MPCPHCRRPISAERLNTHIEQNHKEGALKPILRATEQDILQTWNRAEKIRSEFGSPKKRRELDNSPYRRRNQAPACYLCGEDLGKGVSLKQHFETCEGRPTLEGSAERKKQLDMTTGYID